jgi:hypothetical protein
MAALRPGAVSGYRSHGAEYRADAGSPHPYSFAQSPVTGGHHPSLQAEPLASPAGLRKPLEAGKRLADFVQHAQFGSLPPRTGLPPGPGMPYNRGWSPAAAQPHGSGAPAHGGVIWTRGGPLADAISGTHPPAIPAAAPARQALPPASSPKMIRGTAEPADGA